MARTILALLCLSLGKLLLSCQASSSDGKLCGNFSTADEVAEGQSLGHRVAIVTGGDSGLGYAMAEVLAKQGASVVIASHNLEKCQEAARNITAQVGGNVVGMALDLSSFMSVRAFASQFLRENKVLHYLVLNAGVSGLNSHHEASSYKTQDGFEDVFQINYLGHFLLTELLLPTLRNNRGFSPSRIVSTASMQHYRACTTLNTTEGCFKDWTYFPPPVSKQWIVNGTQQHTTTYGLSKFALIQHAAELSVREANNSIQAFSIGPGLVNTTMNHYMNLTQVCESWSHFQDPCPFSTAQGAAVIAAALFKATHAGGWYTRFTGCSEDMPIEMHGFTKAMRSELYTRSLQWVGIAMSDRTLIV